MTLVAKEWSYFSERAHKTGSYYHRRGLEVGDGDVVCMGDGHPLGLTEEITEWVGKEGGMLWRSRRFDGLVSG